MQHQSDTMTHELEILSVNNFENLYENVVDTLAMWTDPWKASE